MKAIYCSDTGYDCPSVVMAETVEDVLNLALTHAREVHGENPTPELYDQLTLIVREI